MEGRWQARQSKQRLALRGQPWRRGQGLGECGNLADDCTDLGSAWAGMPSQSLVPLAAAHLPAPGQVAAGARRMERGPFNRWPNGAMALIIGIRLFLAQM